MTQDLQSSQAAETDLSHQLAMAENRGAQRVRAQVRDLLDDRRRIVRLGDQQIEVVEVSAIIDLLGQGPQIT